MSFLKNKSELLSEVAVARSVNENFPSLNKNTPNSKSVKSADGNIIPFLLDVLQEVSGKGVQTVLFGNENSNQESSGNFINNGGIFGKIGEVEEISKNTFVDWCMSTFFQDEDPVVGDLLTPNDDVLIETNIQNIDIEEKLKIDPKTTSGNFFYGNIDNNSLIVNGPTATLTPNTKTIDFRHFMYETISVGQGDYRGLLLFDYNNNNETIRVSTTTQSKNLRVREFIKILLNRTQILDLRLLSLELLNVIYGTTVSSTGIGKDYLTDQIKFKKYVDKLTNQFSLEEENDITIIDDGFFVFNKSDIDDINKEVDSIVRGVNSVDLGCGFGENFVDLNDLIDFNNSNNNIDYPYFMENNITQEFKTLVSNSILAGPGEDNKSSIENNIFGNMLNNLLSVIIKFFTLNPMMVLIRQILSRFTNGVINNYNQTKSLTSRPIDQLFRDSISWLKCIWKRVWSWIIEFIFNLIKPEILRLVAVLTAKIIDEKTKNKFKLAQRTRELLANVNNILSFIRSAQT
jgi:hypothetical protein